MGVLDRLEKEALASRERREASARSRARQDSAAHTRLALALDRAARYLQALATHLGELDHGVSARYRLDDEVELGDLRQHGYRVARDEDEEGEGGRNAGVRLLFECTGPAVQALRIDGHARAEALARRLREAGLTCRASAASQRTMDVQVDAKVPVSVRVSPDLERGCVWLELRNLDGLGVQRYPLEPERIDEELLDAVAHLVLREPSRFAQLTGSVVDGDRREDLQRRLARAQRQRDAQLAGGVRLRVFPVAEWFRRRFLGG